MTTVSAWVTPTPHRTLRSVDLVRIVLAIVLFCHPAHALLHPEDARALGQALTDRGLPFGDALAWLALVTVLVCSLALLVRRLVAPAAIGAIAVVAGGLVLYAPYWFVVGGAAEEGHPGMELNVQLLGCLAGVLWAYWPSVANRARAVDRGFDVIRIISALALVPHGSLAFLTWDVEGMRGWGEAMTGLGFPCGVALVWGIKALELTSSLARLARRLVVPACVGNLIVIVPGMWIAHHLRWFVNGPGENGVEFSVVLIAGAVASILAYWPARQAVPALVPAAGLPSSAR